MDLTTKQLIILDYIKRFIAEKKYSPTVREIMNDLALKSPSTVHEHLKNLANMGIITYSPSKPRTIELLVENEYLVDDSLVQIPMINDNSYLMFYKKMLNVKDISMLCAYKVNNITYIIDKNSTKDKISLYKGNEYYISEKSNDYLVGNVIYKIEEM